MKKSISLILAIILCFSLASCSFGGKDTNKTTKSATVKITFPEGYTVLQTAELLEQKEVCSAADFISACNNIPDGYAALFEGMNPDNKLFLLEGYIFPDTYDFYVGEGAENALKRFLGNTKSKITKEDFARARELGYTMDQIITLASIIQSEASVASEMPAVSSVFHNRLEKSNAGFPYLGSDVTRHYIEKKAKTYIDENNLDYNNLFAAYCTNDGYDNKTKGLPSGAICSPGYSAIKAALYPSDTDYLYFFTDKDGNYHYNTTLAAHQSEYAKLYNK